MSNSPNPLVSKVSVVDGALNETAASQLTELQSMNTKLADLKTYTDGLEAALTSLQTYVDGIEGYTDGLETLIGSTNSAISTTNSSLSTIAGYLDQLEGYVDQLEGYLDTVEAKLDAIKSGSALNGIAWNYYSCNENTATQDILTYKSGGSGGTTVATVTINYTDSDQSKILNFLVSV